MKITANTIKFVVEQEDARGCCTMAEAMRIQLGFNYKKIFETVHAATGISEGEWDALLEQGESGEERSIARQNRR